MWIYPWTINPGEWVSRFDQFTVLTIYGSFRANIINIADRQIDKNYPLQ